MKVDYKKLKEDKNGWWLLLDSVMMMLLVFNLVWMIFDFSFTVQFIQDVIFHISPEFHSFYADVIHPNFLIYDFAFVVVFLAEFLFRWIVAVVQKTYPSWASYPFVFWYDLIGCIPLASFRFLRLIRIVTLIVRLQKKGVIDVTDTWWYKFGNRNYQMFVEEVSDRVSSNILTGVQKELEYGDDTNKRIIREVIEPRQEEFAEWVAMKMRYAVNEAYTLHKNEIQQYLEESIRHAVAENSEVKRLDKMPIVGPQIGKALASSIADISFNLIDKVMVDLTTDNANNLVTKAVDVSVKTAMYDPHDDHISEISNAIISDTIEVIKKQVNKKHFDK